MKVTFFLLLTLASALLGQTEYCSSIENCDHCSHWYDYSVTGLSWTSSMGETHKQFSDSMKEALNIMKSINETEIKSNDIHDLHISIQYLCCYFTSTYTTIANAMMSVQWEPIPLYLDELICNYDPSNKTTSFIVKVNDEGQQALHALVASFEDAIEAAGVPVHKKRADQELFHSTLAVVHDGYPIEDALNAINAQITQYNSDPLIMEQFVWITFPTYSFNATEAMLDTKQNPVMFEFRANKK